MVRTVVRLVALGLAFAAAAAPALRDDPAPSTAPSVHELRTDGEPTRVETLRAGARRGEATGVLIKLVELAVEGGVVRHLEVALPGVESVVHLVEEHTSTGTRLIHREVTGTRGRTLRLVRTSASAFDLVTYGEGRTLRRALEVPAGTYLPLERLELERQGRVKSGPFDLVDPLIGRVESLVAERVEIRVPNYSWSGPATRLVVWQHTDATGLCHRRAWFLGDSLVALSVAPGRALATTLDPTRFDALRESDSRVASVAPSAAPR